MSQQINPGDLVSVSTTPGFKDKNGSLVDPTTVRLRWRVFSSDEETVWTYGTDAQVIRDSVGLYHADIPVTKVGVHTFRWEGEGALIAAEEGTFRSVSRF
jgi:hypothetical protein